MTPIPPPEGNKTVALFGRPRSEAETGLHVGIFRYEIRRWRDGVIPDISFAVASPVRLSRMTLASCSKLSIWCRSADTGMGSL